MVAGASVAQYECDFVSLLIIKLRFFSSGKNIINDFSILKLNLGYNPHLNLEFPYNV